MSTLVHADMSGAFPINIGPDKFFEASVSGCAVVFCPAIYTGQLRGADILSDGEVTFGTSGDYKNTLFSGPIDGLSDVDAEALSLNVEEVCNKGDICSVPDLGNVALNTYQRRTAEVLYAADLFFAEIPDVANNTEMLDHDILDTAAEIDALILLLGENSDAGLALAAFAGPTDPVPTVSQWGLVVMALLTALIGTLVFRRRPVQA